MRDVINYRLKAYIHTDLKHIHICFARKEKTFLGDDTSIINFGLVPKISIHSGVMRILKYNQASVGSDETSVC